MLQRLNSKLVTSSEDRLLAHLLLPPNRAGVANSRSAFTSRWLIYKGASKNLEFIFYFFKAVSIKKTETGSKSVRIVKGSRLTENFVNIYNLFEINTSIISPLANETIDDDIAVCY